MGFHMTVCLIILFCLAVLVLAAALAWRLISRRHAFPCPAWLGRLVEIENPFLRVHHSRFLVDSLGLKPGMHVLDFGCGPGRITVPAARAVGPNGMVTAVDMQSGMLKRAREKAKAAKLKNIRFVHAKAGDGKLGQRLFDRALLVTVLGEIPGKEEALKEIFNALKKGGILSVTEIIVDPHFQGRNKVARLAEAAGFREKECYGNRFAYTMHLEK